MLFVGMSAWADTGDVTTNVDIDFSNAIVSSGTSPKYSIAGATGSMTWERQWAYSPSVSDGILYFGNFDSYGSATTDFGGGVVELQNNNIRSKDVVVIKFDLAFSKLSGKHVGFSFVDTSGTTILTQWFDAYNGDFDNYNPLGLDWSEMYRDNNTVFQDRCVYFTITIDYSQNTIKTETVCYKSGTDKAATNGSHTVSLPSSTPIGYFVLLGNLNNGDRPSSFDNLLIKTTEGDYSVATADYTVQWKCGDNVIKSDTRSGDVGSTISLFPSDTQNFTLNEGTQTEQRYKYSSNDLSTHNTIAAGGTTVVTINVTEAEKWAYTITSSFSGNALGWSTSGSVWEDQNTVTVQYPRFQAYGTTLVGREPVSNDLQVKITVTENNYATALEYTSAEINNLYLLAEAENLGTGLGTNATTYTSRVSNKLIAYGSSGTLLNLPAGKYIFTLGVIGGDNNTHKVNYTVSAGATEIISGTCTANTLSLMHSEEFTLTSSTDITFTCSDPASGRGIDLIYIQKTGEVAKIGETGWTSFASPYALDLSGIDGGTAYYASSVGERITMTSTEATVPAGEGLLLKGTADATVTIPIATTDGTAIEGNKLVGCTSALEITKNTAGYEYFYVLASNNGKAEFQNIKNYVGTDNHTVTIPAGKAYLDGYPTGPARALNMVFEEENVTGVNSVQGSGSKVNGYYDLQGRRVSQPTKGLYIMDGKKIIIK